MKVTTGIVWLAALDCGLTSMYMPTSPDAPEISLASTFGPSSEYVTLTFHGNSAAAPGMREIAALLALFTTYSRVASPLSSVTA